VKSEAFRSPKVEFPLSGTVSEIATYTSPYRFSESWITRLHYLGGFTNFEKNTQMNQADILRNNIIDKLLTISNKDYLAALYQLVENSSVDNDIVKLSEEQILMLQLSDKDIMLGKLISQEDLDKNDMQWLKEQ
jgi:hypothetical protein